MSRKNDTGKKIAIGAAIAGAVGYVTGLLTAPQSGKETREDIKEKGEGAVYSAEAQLQALNVELRDMVAETKVKTVALSAKARQEFDEAVVAAKDAQNKASTILKSIKKGEAEDPQLNKAIKQAKLAKKNLGKFLKK